MKIKKHHIEELIAFLRDPHDFDQTSNVRCCGAHLARIMGKPQVLIFVVNAFLTQFKTACKDEYPFHTYFKGGDPDRIADWFEEEVLNKYFKDNLVDDEWVTVDGHPVSILHVDNNDTMVGYYTLPSGHKINDIWKKDGNNFRMTNGHIKRKYFTPEIGVNYIVTEEFTNSSVIYPVDSILTWKNDSLVTASIVEHRSSLYVNGEWAFVLNQKTYPLRKI